MCCGQSALADCINAKQSWLRQVKSAERTFELHTPHISRGSLFCVNTIMLFINIHNTITTLTLYCHIINNTNRISLSTI